MRRLDAQIRTGVGGQWQREARGRGERLRPAHTRSHDRESPRPPSPAVCPCRHPMGSRGQRQSRQQAVVRNKSGPQRAATDKGRGCPTFPGCGGQGWHCGKDIAKIIIYKVGTKPQIREEGGGGGNGWPEAESPAASSTQRSTHRDRAGVTLPHPRRSLWGQSGASPLPAAQHTLNSALQPGLQNTELTAGPGTSGLPCVALP